MMTPRLAHALPLLGCLAACGPAPGKDEVAAAPPAALVSSDFTAFTEVPGGGLTDQGLAAQSSYQSLILYAVGRDRQVYENRMRAPGGPGTWTGWTVVPGVLSQGAPTVTRCYDGLHLFVTTPEGRIFYNVYNDLGFYTGWGEVYGDGRTALSPAAACLHNGSGGLRLYVNGLDGKIYENVRSFAGQQVAWAGWTGWRQIAAPFTTQQPVAVVEGGPRSSYESMYLVAVDSAGGLQWTRYGTNAYYALNGTFSPWQSLPTLGISGVRQPSAMGPMALAMHQNKLALFTRRYFPASCSTATLGCTKPRPAYYNLQMNTMDPETGLWDGWTGFGDLSGPTVIASDFQSCPSAPYAGLYLFARSPDGRIQSGLQRSYPAATGNCPPPPPPPPPTTQVVTTWAPLFQQPIFSGPAAYATQFPALGTIKNGKLLSLSNSNTFPILLVKPGRSSAECATDATATVPLAPGSTATASAVYGVAQQTLPVYILACILDGASNASQIQVNVTYQYDL